MTIVDRARAQHNGLFRQMALGGVWHLYRAPDSDNVALMRSDAQWDVPQWPIMVANVHAMTADRLANKVQAVIRA